jgi:hypothetical protein
MVEPFDLGDSLGAYRALVQGRFGVPLDLDNFSIFYMDQKTATPMVHARAKGFNDHFLYPCHRGHSAA